MKPYLESAKSSQHIYIPFIYNYFNIILNLILDLESSLFLSGFATEVFYAFHLPILDICPAHLIFFEVTVLIIFEEEHRLCNVRDQKIKSDWVKKINKNVTALELLS